MVLIKFYLGSYTRLGGPGIGVCQWNGGKLDLLSSTLIANPTYVILNQRKTRLYSVCSDPVTGTGGSAAAFQIQENALKPLSRQDTVGMGPCHLCLSPDERFLYTANYAAGSLSVFPLDSNGGLGTLLQHIQHEGGSVHPSRQTGPHAHQVSFLPGTSFLCCVDLGMDALVTYKQDPESGLLQLHDRYDTAPGYGPRHVAYGDNGIAYLVHELASKIEVLQRKDSRWHSLQILSMLPKGWQGESTAAAVRLDREARRLFASNRGHNSIAIFDVAEDGTLSLRSIAPTGDDYPRDFNLVQGGLLIAHQKGGLRMMELDHQDMLVCKAELEVHGAVCVCTGSGL